MKGRTPGAVVLGAAAMLAAGGANAATYVVTFSGTVAEGTDAAGLFGGTTSLDGADFSVSYTFHYPSDQVTILPTSTPGMRGYLVEADGPQAVDVRLTIFGTSLYMGGDFARYLRDVATGSGTARQIGAVSQYEQGGRQGTTRYEVSAQLHAAETAFFDSVDPLAPLDYTVRDERGQDVSGLGRFEIGMLGAASPLASGTFNVGRVQVAELAAAVPEPASWAMMIAGFGLTGSAMRRQRARLRGLDPSLA